MVGTVGVVMVVVVVVVLDKAGFQISKTQKFGSVIGADSAPVVSYSHVRMIIRKPRNISLKTLTTKFCSIGST